MRRLHAGLFLAGSVLVAGCGIFGGDEEELPPAELTEIVETVKVKKRWSTKVGSKARDLRLGLAPVSDAIRAYAAGVDGQVHAMALDTGKKIWTTNLRLTLSAGPGVGDGRVVVAGADGLIVALDAASGEEQWRRDIAAEILATPALGGERVVLRSADGRLLGLNAATGAEEWVIEEEVPRLSLRGTAAPLIASSLVVCGFDNGRLMAADLLSGEIVWDQIITPPTGRSDLERLVDIDGKALAVGRELYVTGFQGQVASLMLESGQLLWSREVSSYQGPAVDWSNTFVATENGHVVALSRANGVEQWRNESLLRRELTTPVAFNNHVVVGDLEGYLHWIDAATGTISARRRLDNVRISGLPHAQGDLLLVQAESGVVAAFEVVTPES